jgi:hypothetical protein
MVSPDGKTLTLTVTGTNARGQKRHNVIVYDKQVALFRTEPFRAT